MGNVSVCNPHVAIAGTFPRRCPGLDTWANEIRAVQMKQKRANLARLEDIPNVGPAVAADLRQLGIAEPVDLLDRDPYEMYDDLCRLTGQRHDPCLLDTFIAAVRYMQGEPKQPWWSYTAERKRILAAREASN